MSDDAYFTNRHFYPSHTSPEIDLRQSHENHFPPLNSTNPNSSTRSPPVHVLQPSPLRQPPQTLQKYRQESSSPSPLDLDKVDNKDASRRFKNSGSSYIVYPSEASMNMEEDSESAQVTIQPISFVLSPSTQSRKLKDLTEMQSSVDLALRTQPSQQPRSGQKYYPLPPRPSSRNEHLRQRGISTERESFTTKSESLNNRDMSRTSQNFIESVARYSNHQREGPETIKEESRDSGSISEDHPPSRNRSRDIFEINLKEVSQSEFGNSSVQQSESARRQLRFSSIKQDSPPRGKLPEVPPFKIEMHSRQAYSNFNYDEQGMVSVRGEENQPQHTIRVGTQEMENSGNFKTLSTSRSQANIGRAPLIHINEEIGQRLPLSVIQALKSLQAKNIRLQDRVENLTKVNEATVMQMRPILNKNQDLEKENEELRILVQTQDERYQEVRMELHNVKERLQQCEQISGERSESIQKKHNAEREQRMIVERENEALKRDKEELIQEINKSTNNTNNIVSKLEQDYREYKERMSQELIAKDNLVQDLRKQVGGRNDSHEKWLVLQRKQSSSSGQTTARNSRRPSTQALRKRNESNKLLAEENFKLREELNRHKDEIMRLKSKLQRSNRSKHYIERKQQESERSRSNAESYVQQAIMANQKLTKRIDHKNAKIQRLKKKIRNMSNESGSQRGESFRGSERGGSTFRQHSVATVRQGHDQGVDLRGRVPSTNTTWRPNQSEDFQQWRPHDSQEMFYQVIPPTKKLTRQSSAPQLLQATQLSSNLSRPVQRRLHSRDISQSPRSLSIEKLQNERFQKQRSKYLEVGHVSHIPSSSSYLENERYTSYPEEQERRPQEGRMKDYYKYNNEYMNRQAVQNQMKRNTNHLQRSALTYMSRKYDTDMIGHEPSINTLSSIDFKQEMEHMARQKQHSRRMRLEAELNRLQQDYAKLMRYSKSLMENHKAKERTRRELNEMARAMQIKQTELNCM